MPHPNVLTFSSQCIVGRVRLALFLRATSAFQMPVVPTWDRGAQEHRGLGSSVSSPYHCVTHPCKKNTQIQAAISFTRGIASFSSLVIRILGQMRYYG